MEDKVKRGNIFYFFTMLHISIAPYTFWIAMSVLYFIFYSALGYDIFNSDWFLPFYLVLSTFFLTLIPIMGHFANSEDSFFDTFKLKRISIKNIILIILISLFIQPFMSVLSVIGMFFSPNYISEVVFELTKVPYVVALFTIAIVPAVCEEFLMRGVVLKYYEDLPLFKMAVINGLFFGLMHGNLQQFFYASFLGFVFVYFVKLTGSVLSSILAHFVINGSQLTLSYILMDTNIQSSATSSVGMYDLFYTIIYALPFSIICLILIKLFIKNNKKEYTYIKEKEKLIRDSGEFEKVKVVDKFFIAMLVVYTIQLIMF